MRLKVTLCINCVGPMELNYLKTFIQSKNARVLLGYFDGNVIRTTHNGIVRSKLFSGLFSH